MKAIILAGGYAKRLWPETLQKSKPLLDLAGEPIINHIIRKVDGLPGIEEVLVSTNRRFKKDYEEWLKKYKFTKVRIAIEDTSREEEKLGAIGGLHHLIGKEGVKEDCLVLAGDNVVTFDLSVFIDFYRKCKSPVIAAFDIKSREKAKLYGVLKIDGNSRVIDFREKPEKPESTLISMACYILTKQAITLLDKYVEEGNPRDNPGFFIRWLYRKMDVYTFVFDTAWFDIGDKESLQKAREFVGLDSQLR